jgi:integrase
VITIYRDPLKAPVVDNDKTQGDEAPKQYDSYLVTYYQGGRRIRNRFSSSQEAKDTANAVKAKLLNNDSAALSLSGQDSLIYARAKNLTAHLGLALDEIANQFTQAKAVLGDTDLMEAIRFFERFGKTVKTNKAVSDVVTELTDTLKADGKSDYHIRDMKARLQAFSQAFPKPIQEVRTKEIADWLRALKGRNKRGEEVILSAKTRNHYRNSVVQLFNFSRDHGYLPKGMPTDAEAVKTLDVVSPANEIFTLDEIRTLLDGAPERLLVPMAIKAFAGIRTEEMLSLRWENLNFDTKHIVLSADVTKTKQRRIIPMQENLIAWLTTHKKKEGRICPRWQRPQALVQAFDRHGKRMGLDVGANKFRNSYISYRVAVTHDVGKVSLESGNSPRVIQREYLELATEQQGKDWFAVGPKVKFKAAKKRNRRKRMNTRTPRGDHYALDRSTGSNVSI